jgi:radical SAM superfamily enzyme YgiQ (UPF0313 family)
MKYEGMIIRPPSEADSLLLQVTVGCSHNRCTFCRTFKSKKFRIKADEEIDEDIREASRFRSVPRVFLCDGDALIIPQKRLTGILGAIGAKVKGVERIGSYANAKSILKKTPDDLRRLRELGLGIVYMGVETGNEELLAAIQKKATYQQLVEAGRRIKDAGITLSVTVLLGIGGIEKSIQHALDTARILTEIDPDYVGALTVMLVPGTPLHDDYLAGRFVLPDTFGFLRELELMIAHSDYTNCFFTANHASNYLPIRARMPDEKAETLRRIREVIAAGDKSRLRPEFMRGL